jgi:hypothetical protein
MCVSLILFALEAFQSSVVQGLRHLFLRTKAVRDTTPLKKSIAKRKEIKAPHFSRISWEIPNPKSQTLANILRQPGAERWEEVQCTLKKKVNLEGIRCKVICAALGWWIFFINPCQV